MIGFALKIARHADAAITELAGGGYGYTMTAKHAHDGLADWDVVFDTALCEPDAERAIFGDTRRRRLCEIFAVHRADRPLLCCCGHRRHQARRAAIVEVGSGWGIAQR